MKKKVLTSIIAFFALALVACSPAQEGESSASNSSSSSVSSQSTTSKHQHTYNEDVWEKDEKQHWHPATCEHTDSKGSAGAHQFEDVPNSGTPATCDQPGSKEQRCKVCGYTKTVVVKAEHDFQDVTPAHEKGEGEVTETIQKCSRDNTYKIGWDAQDANKTSSNFNSEGKWSSGGYAQYKFYSPIALKARLYVKMANRGDDAPYDRETKSGNQSVWYDFYNGGWKYTVTVNTDTTIDQDKQDPIDVNGQSIGMDELLYSDFLEEGQDLLVAPWFEFDVAEGQNTIRIARNKGYSVSAKEFYVIGSLVA